MFLMEYLIILISVYAFRCEYMYLPSLLSLLLHIHCRKPNCDLAVTPVTCKKHFPAVHCLSLAQYKMTAVTGKFEKRACG